MKDKYYWAIRDAIVSKVKDPTIAENLMQIASHNDSFVFNSAEIDKIEFEQNFTVMKVYLGKASLVTIE